MDFAIQQSCPSCGANIELHEDDRVIRCSFCDNANYKIGTIGDRYTLPLKIPPTIDPEQLLFAPYLRFKGSVFYIKGLEIKYKIIDTTRTACKGHKLPISLGVRPQAMLLQPLTARHQGQFVKQTVPTKEVFRHAAAVAELFDNRSEVPIYHRSFIGETISRIYQPYLLIGDEVIDAVNERVVGDENLIRLGAAETCRSKRSWEPQFIGMHCPSCGGQLQGEYNSVVQQCGNCKLLWQEHGKKFIAISWHVVENDAREVRYLPFWRTKLHTGGTVMNSFGDFLRFTRQPSMTALEHRNQPLYYFFPAFKLNPKSFLQLASQLTVSQYKIPPCQPQRVISRAHPVFLNHTEALQSYKTILANCSIAKEKCYPLLPQIKLIDYSCELLYLPFLEQSHDLIQEHTGAVVQQAALRFGRSL